MASAYLSPFYHEEKNVLRGKLPQPVFERNVVSRSFRSICLAALELYEFND